MGFIESLLGSAKADLSNLIIYIAIVAAFIVGLIMCIAPVLETRSRLRRAIRSIKAGEKGAPLLAGGQLPRQGHADAPLERLSEQSVLRRRRVSQRQSTLEDFINEETVIYEPGLLGLCRRGARACWCRWAFWAR